MGKAAGRWGGSKRSVSKVEPTDERITGHGNTTHFIRDIDQPKMLPMLLLPCFEDLRKNRKEIPAEGLLKQIFCFLLKAGFESMLNPKGITGCYHCHHRGRSALTFLVFKAFADRQLPSERLRPNAALYYLMCIPFFHYKAFKKDVCGEIVPLTSYPKIPRWEVIDIAAKTICRGGTLRLKVSRAVREIVNLARLRASCHMASYVSLQ